jgi:hypothetical protein
MSKAGDGNEIEDKPDIYIVMLIPDIEINTGAQQ